MDRSSISLGGGVEVIGLWSQPASIDDVAGAAIRGLHSADVSLFGVALGCPAQIPWPQHVTLGVFSVCPFLGGDEVVLRVALGDGEVRVDLGTADTWSGFDVEIGLDWMALIGWMPDRSVLLGDLLVAGMRLNGDITALSAIDGARVLSGLAWGCGAGRDVRAANLALLAHLGRRSDQQTTGPTAS